MSVTYVKEGKYFQTEGAENWKACLEISVLVNGWTSSGMEDESKARLQTRSVIRSSYMCVYLIVAFLNASIFCVTSTAVICPFPTIHAQ